MFKRLRKVWPGSVQIMALAAVMPMLSFGESQPIRLVKNNDIEWGDSTVWEGGKVPADGDVVDFHMADGSTGNSYIRLPNSAWSVDTIVGSYNNFFLYMPWNGDRGALFGVREIRSWDSIQPIGSRAWTTARSLSGFSLLGSEESPTWLPNLFGGYRPDIGVPDGKAGVVDALWNRGAFDKSGAGKLTVKAPVDENIGINLKGGTLSVSGGTDVASDSEIAPGAYLHLDASKEDSLTTEGDTVVSWTDPESGRSVAELPAGWKDGWSAASGFVLPTLDRGHAVGGHPLVKFGVLALPEMVTTVREVFVVMAADQLDDNVMTPLGCHGWTGRNFHLDRRFDPANYSVNGLVNYYARENVLDAKLAINGNPVPWTLYPSDPQELRILSYSFAANRTVSLIGADRNTSASGGFRMAELVIYTKELTAAERRQTVAALKRRWLGDGATHDLGIVKVEAANAKIDVPANEVASVRTVNDIGGHGIVKTGEGELVLDRVQPDTARIEVRGGSIGFACKSAVPAADAAVAANPLFHLDASDADSLSGEDGVSAWHDTRKDVDFSANLCAGADKPTVSAAAPTGLSVVDFGNRLDETGPRLQFSSVQNAYEGFIVWRNIYSQSDAQNLPAIFGSASYPNFRYQSRGNLFSRWYNDRFVESAIWTVNGVVINPDSSEFGNRFGGGENGFVVIHFVATNPMALGGVADSFNDKSVSRGGGCQVAEFIGYDRLLTDKERRATESALMSKWLGEDHPDRKGWSGTLAFAEGVEPEVRAESDVTVAAVEANGTLVKDGEGTLVVKAASGITGYDVRGGALSAKDDMLADAYFHVDASDGDSLVKVPGSATGEVSQWLDVRRNGRYAQALVTNVGNSEHLLKYPQLKTVTISGLVEGMPYVDFHHLARPTASDDLPGFADVDCATMRWVDENGATTASKEIREVHIVYREDFEYVHDTLGYLSYQYSAGSFMGYYGSGGDINYQFLRGDMATWTTSIFASFSSETQKAEMRMDGEYIPPNTYCTGKNPNFHVLSLASAVNLQANCFCNDRGNCGAGGYKIAEVVVYTGKTNSYEKFTAINDYLCKKWRGIGDGSKLPTTGSLKATAGTLNLASATGAVVPKDNSSLEFTFRGADDYGKIEIDGDFVLPSHGTLTVNLPQRGETKPEPGKYVLLKAKSLIGAEDLSGWTISAGTTANYGATVKFDVVNGEIVLEISRNGGMILIR